MYSCYYGAMIELAHELRLFAYTHVQSDIQTALICKANLDSNCNLFLDMRQNPPRDTHFSYYGRHPLKQTNEAILMHSFITAIILEMLFGLPN